MNLHATHFVNEHSSEPSIIILHGLFGSNRNWYPVARSLSKHHDVFSLDLRNHGKSPHSDDMDYPSMAQDVLDFMDRNNLNTVRVIAHSMGGKVAMWLTLNHPDRVTKLVVVDIAPVAYEHDFSDVLNAFKVIPLDTIKSRKEADEHLARVIEQKALRQFLLQNLQIKAGQFRWRLNLKAIECAIENITGFPETDTIPVFNKRVLFVAGGLSDYLTKDKHDQIRTLFPMASFSTIKMAGHWLHAEQPELFKVLIENYL